MSEYQDMRIFCLENGGVHAQKVKDERALRFHGEWALRFPFKVKEYPAFIVLNKELQALIASINQKNIRLIHLCSNLPKDAVYQYAINSMIEEIQQSNEFENVNSTRKEIREAVDDLHVESSNKRFMGMVRKYNMLISHKDISLKSSSDIRKLYDEFILDEVRRENPHNAPDGTVFRKDQNYVNQGERIIHEGLYPERKIIEAMDGALAMLCDESIDPLIRVAVFHYAFGYIHPFYDGNGRMSRFISSYVLSQYGYSESACLRISYVIKDHRSIYQRIYKNANETRSMGDLTCFVIEFLRFIEMAIDDTFMSLQQKQQIHHHYKALMHRFVILHQKTLGKYEALLYVMLKNELFGNMVFDVQSLAQIAGMSANTIRKIIELCGELMVCKKEGTKYTYRINRDYLDQFSEYLPSE